MRLKVQNPARKKTYVKYNFYHLHLYRICKNTAVYMQKSYLLIYMFKYILVSCGLIRSLVIATMIWLH